MAACILLGVFGQTAIASDLVTMSYKIPCLNDNVGSGNFQNECTWTSAMPAAMVAQSKGIVVLTDQDLSMVSGKKLFINATHVHAVGGDRFSGPKWISLDGKLMEDGKLLGNFQWSRTTSGGKFGACATLEFISKALTKDVLNWLKNPQRMAVPVASPET